MVMRRVMAAVGMVSVAAAVWVPFPAVAASATVAPLLVTRVKVPPLDLVRWDTSGYYPHVSGTGAKIAAVNTALRKQVLHEEAIVSNGYDPGMFPSRFRGTFALGFTTAMMSASTVVVSTIYPSEVLYPGGNDGSGWIYDTIDVANGKTEPLVALLHSRTTGLEAIATYVKKHVVATNACVRFAVTEPGTGSIAAAGFAPTVSNYTDFALASTGLVVGLGQGQVGAEACGTIRVVVPWSVAHPLLSATGRLLVAGLA